mgnify:CR=1 FL=1
MIESEGYIKFQCEWEEKAFFFPKEQYDYLNGWRQKLYALNLVGAYDDGVGFGNLSIREDTTDCFVITGSATGNYPILQKKHYAKVIDCDVASNYVKCIGGTRASSESLTHSAVYRTLPTVNAVIHTHHRSMWNKYYNLKPTTDPRAAFGTPELAMEIQDILRYEYARREKFIVLGGHEEGILAFGKDLDEAGEILVHYRNKIENQID